MTKPLSIFWFRQDLRLSDNPALTQAAAQGPVLPLYILDDTTAQDAALGTASRWWLHHSLKDLNQSLHNALQVYTGSSETVFKTLLKKHTVSAVYFNDCYEPWRIKNDNAIKALLKSHNIPCITSNGSLLWDPATLLKKDGTSYKMYTPFYRTARTAMPSPRKPLPIPKTLDLVHDTPTHSIDSLKLLPSKNYAAQLEKNKWHIGEKAAHKKLSDFLRTQLLGYDAGRNYPAQSHTSYLSPSLHHGELSPNQAWHGVLETTHGSKKDSETFLKELVWREFCHYLLYHFPALPHKNFQPKFDTFPWHTNKKLLEAWQQGKTGYPLVDAGMRELLQTGYMHNRVRMVVASFLIKNLSIHWHEGQAWFWDHLVDADLANNSGNWQWVAGSGADAAPYFRIFNTITQGEKFDKEGEYTRRFVPELAALPNKYLFKPWQAPESVLKAAGVILGTDYPYPIIDLQESRIHALKAYKGLST